MRELEDGVGSLYPLEYLALSSGDASVGPGKLGLEITFVDVEGMLRVESGALPQTQSSESAAQVLWRNVVKVQEEPIRRCRLARQLSR